MSKPANNPSPKSRKWKWIVTSLLAIGGGVIALCFWFSGATFRNSDPAFRGKPESEWVKNLKYWDDEQVKDWRGYGEEGVQVLIRGLQHAAHPGERTTRMCLVSLLSSLGNDAKSATPIMIWTLVHDADDEVRQSTIRFFTSSEDEKKCLLNQLPAAQKRELLPALIHSLQNTGDWGVRNNAANALKWFPEEKTVVAPALIAALQDPQPQVRLLAAEALKRVDPEAATKANAVAIVLALTKDPDDQVAAGAISALRSFKSDAEVVVPVLVEVLESTNTLVASQAVWILEGSGGEFGSYSNTVVPALTKAAQRKDNVGGHAKVALERFQSGVNSTQATK